MENCIFCKIVKGELPAHIVYEDQDFLAFLDSNPQSPGHVQVIPKVHYRWVWDVPSEVSAKGGEPTIEHYFGLVQKIAVAQRKAFATDFVLSKIVGDEVPHAHVWVFPNSNVKGDKKAFEYNAATIKNNLLF